MISKTELHLLMLLINGRRQLTVDRAKEVERLLVRADESQARAILLHWGRERREYGFNWHPSSACRGAFCSPGSETLQALLLILSDRSAGEDVRSELFGVFRKEPAVRALAIELLFEPSIVLSVFKEATATLADSTMPEELQVRILQLARNGSTDQRRVLLNLFWNMVDNGICIISDVEAWLLNPDNLTFAMRSFDYAWVGQAATELDTTLVRQSCEALLRSDDRIIRDGARIAMGLEGREYAAGRRERRKNGGTA